MNNGALLSGGSGGGGLGAGGGIAVLNNGDNPTVTLSNVNFSNTLAQGGSGGSGGSVARPSGGGGAGLGGALFVMGRTDGSYVLDFTGGGTQSGGTAVGGAKGNVGSATAGSGAGAGMFLVDFGGVRVTNTAGETLTFNNNITDEEGSGLSGGGGGSGRWSLEKHGAGTLVLGGTNAFTNGTNLWGGTIINNGSLSSTVQVRNAVTLSGSGTFSALVTTHSGAILAPGNSPGTMTYTGGLTINDGTVFNFELGTTSDLIVVSGGTLTGPTSAAGATFNLTDSGGFGEGTYDLINGTGATLSSFDATGFTVGTGIFGYDFSFSLAGSTLQLTATLAAVPEPARAGLLLGLAGWGWVLLRRRR